jgi:hypothetical protein
MALSAATHDAPDATGFWALLIVVIARYVLLI